MLRILALVGIAAAAVFGIKKLMSSNEPEIDEFAPSADPYMPSEPYAPSEPSPAVQA